MSCPKLEIPNLGMPDFHQFKIYTNIINASVIKKPSHNSPKLQNQRDAMYLSPTSAISDILKLHKIFFPIADFFHGFFLRYNQFFYNSTIFFYIRTRKKYLAIN